MHVEKGFTLIELMIVVAVIAILAAIAYPTYQDSVRKSRRADAKAALLELAQWMERSTVAITGRYTRLSGDTVNRDAAGMTAQLPIQQSPRDGGVAYNLSLTALTDSNFTLQAAPTALQTGDPCGTLTVTHTGIKGVIGASYTKDQCW